MKSIVLLGMFLGMNNAQANTDSCDLAISGRAAFGGLHYSENFKAQLENLLEAKGYRVVSHGRFIAADTNIPNKLYLFAEYGYPCGTGVTTADYVFRNFSYASATLETDGKNFEFNKTIWNLPLAPTGKRNMLRAIKKVIRKLPDCTSSN